MKPADLDPRFEAMTRMAHSIGGFMSDANIAVWDTLLCAQQRFGARGNLLEIGVFKGRSASVLCQHKHAEEELWLVDFSLFLAEAERNLSAFHSPEVRFVHQKSSELWESSIVWKDSELSRRARQFRWIHVDGEHTGHAVANDLALAAHLLSEGGLICIDDFFNAAYPQISAATYGWLERHPTELEMILCGDNKAYLCRPTSADRYLDLIKNSFAAELRARGYISFTLFKTSPRGDSNCWGIAPRRDDRDYYGLDESPDSIS